MLLLSIALAGSFGLPVPQDSFQPHRDWPQFRGHRARGQSLPRGPATIRWDVDSGKGVAWRTPIGGLAHSSPVIWGKRVFVTTAVKVDGEAGLSSLYGSEGYGAGDSVPDEGEHSYRLLCLDKGTGEVLWEREAHRGVPLTKRHPKSTHANSTPACDAKRVLAFFGSEGLHAFDHQGEKLWSRDFGVLEAGAPNGIDPSEADQYQWGFAASPILYEDKVVVQCDIQAQSFLAVLDARTGEELWRVDREEPPTWCTPQVHETAAGGKRQIIVNGYRHIGGYDLESGEEIWKLVGGGDVPVPTPIVEEELIYITSAHGRMRPIYAIHTAARGLITADAKNDEAMEWCHLNRGIYMQTPLVDDGLLYACSDGGVLSVFDAFSGEGLYRERLGDGRSGFSGSAVQAGEYLYFTAESGTVHVLRAGPEFEEVAVNGLGETCLATPAISEGCLFFRTRHHLVCVEPPSDGQLGDV